MNFELLLFATDPATVRRSVAAGVDGIVVDWERHGKHARQAGADTQIGADTLDDLIRVREATDGLVVCRVDSDERLVIEQVHAAIDAGADEILLPMVRSAAQVGAALDTIAGRARLGVLLETVDVLDEMSRLKRLPIDRAYVGLNDLAIERRTASIFSPLVDGTLERLRSDLTCPFGFGGLTLPEHGAPIPARLLIGEMARLRCTFSFLRRSYHADLGDKDPSTAIPRIRQALVDASTRSDGAVAGDHAALVAAIDDLEGARVSA